MTSIGVSPLTQATRPQPAKAASTPPTVTDSFAWSTPSGMEDVQRMRGLAQSRTVAGNAQLDLAIEHPEAYFSELENSYAGTSAQNQRRISQSMGRLAGRPLQSMSPYAQKWLRGRAASEKPEDRQAAYEGYAEMRKAGPLKPEDWKALAARPGADLETFLSQNWKDFSPEERKQLGHELCLKMAQGDASALDCMKHFGLAPEGRDCLLLTNLLGKKDALASRAHRWLDELAKGSPEQTTRESAAQALLQSKAELDNPLTLSRPAVQSSNADYRKAAADRLSGPLPEEKRKAHNEEFSHALESYVKRREGWLASDKEKDPVFQLMQNYWALSKADDPKFRDHIDVAKVKANISRLLSTQTVQDLRDGASRKVFGPEAATEQYKYVVSDFLKTRLQLTPAGPERDTLLTKELAQLEQLDPALARKAAQELGVSLQSSGSAGPAGSQPGSGIPAGWAVDGAGKVTEHLLAAELATGLLEKVGGGLSVLEAYTSFSQGDVGGGIGNTLSAAGMFFPPLKLVGTAVTLLFGFSAEETALNNMGVYR